MRVVLDTNVLVSALLFRTGHVSWLREGWQAGRFTPLVDRACAGELLRVLAYPKFRLDREDLQALLAEFLPFAEPVSPDAASAKRLPRCRDSQDQKFLVLAAGGRADVLITGDRALLALAGRTAFAIESPAAFAARHRER